MYSFSNWGACSPLGKRNSYPGIHPVTLEHVIRVRPWEGKRPPNFGAFGPLVARMRSAIYMLYYPLLPSTYDKFNVRLRLFEQVAFNLKLLGHVYTFT